MLYNEPTRCTNYLHFIELLSFVVPYRRICLTHFHFNIVVSVYLFCLLSSAEFYVWLTVHLELCCIMNQHDALIIFTLLSYNKVKIISASCWFVIQHKQKYSEICTNAPYAAISLHRNPVGGPGGDLLAGTF
jgi:hypothetical protein